MVVRTTKTFAAWRRQPYVYVNYRIPGILATALDLAIYYLQAAEIIIKVMAYCVPVACFTATAYTSWTVLT